jgi:hypothetical protein
MDGGIASTPIQRPNEKATENPGDLRCGHFLVMLGAMTASQVDIVMEARHNGDTRPFADIAVAMGFVENNSVLRFACYLDKNDDILL